MNRIEAIIKTQDGRTYTITPTHTTRLNYKANASNGDNIVFGYTAAASFDFSLSNVTGQWDSVILKKAEVKPYIKRDDGENIPLGTFDVEEAKKTDGAVNITSIDRMVIFDQKFAGGTFPMTLGYFVNLLCTQVGIKLATLNFPNSDYSIKDSEGVKGISCRNLLSYACELAGSYAIINTNSELEVKWFDFSNIKENFDYGDASSFTHEESPITLTGARIVFGEETIVSGTDKYPIELTANNVLLNKADKATVQAVLDKLYNERIKLMTYLPCTIKATNPSPELRVGDVVKVKDHKQQEHVALLTALNFNAYLGIEATSAGKAKSESNRYTQGAGSGSSGDKGDKIGFVLGYNTAEYTFTDSTQTVAGCATGGDVDTRMDVQLLATYLFTPSAAQILSLVGDVTGTTKENITGIIDTKDPTKVTRTATGTMTGELTGTGTLNSETPPLVTIEYRVNGVAQMTFYQYPHPGMNTFSASFIPSAQKPGTLSIDLRVTVAGGTVKVEKRQANISLLVKNGEVIDTPPWPEINISQSFSPITILDNGELITVANFEENVTTGVQMPVGGLIEEVFEGIEILDIEPIQVCGMTDSLVMSRIIGGEIFRFNTGYADMYNYSTKYITVSSTDFKEQDTYKFVGVEKPIDAGLMIEVSISTDEFKKINSVEVGVK